MLRPLLPTLLAAPALTFAAEAPFAAMGRNSALPAGDPTPWLALAAIGLIGALLIAQRLVSRR